MRGTSTGSSADRSGTLMRSILDRLRRVEARTPVPVGWMLKTDSDGRLLAVNTDGYSKILADPTTEEN